MEEIELTNSTWQSLTTESKLGFHQLLVLCIREYDDKEESVNKFGRIYAIERTIENTSFDCIPIEFFENIRGHGLSGTVKNGHGWNIPPNYLTIYNKTIDGATMALMKERIIPFPEVTS